MTTAATSEQAVVARLRAAGCVFAEDEARVLLGSAADPDELAVMIEARESGHPLEHIVGWAEFYGRRVQVDPGVFVPRRRTELMVREAVARAHAGARVVDLCCGCAAIGVAIAAALGQVELHAVDLDAAAVRCARRNVAEVGGAAYEGSLYEPLPDRLRGHVDVLVANAPYVPTDAIALMPPEARVHEPRTALDGGVDGLDVQRAVIAQSPSWLAPNGRLLVETSEQQAPRTLAAIRAAGLGARIVRDDDLDATLAVGARGPE